MDALGNGRATSQHWDIAMKQFALVAALFVLSGFASDPNTSQSFDQAIDAYTVYRQFVFGTQARGSKPVIPIRTAKDLAEYFNPRDSYGLANRNGEWQNFAASFDAKSFVFSPNSLKLVVWQSGKFTPGGFTAGQIVAKQYLQPGKSPGAQFLAGEMVAKPDNIAGLQPAFWCYQAHGATGGANELDWFEQPLSTNGVWAINKWVDGGGITPGHLVHNTYNINSWDGYKTTLPFDASKGFHKYQFVWTTKVLYTYVDGILQRAFDYTYNASEPCEVIIYEALGAQHWGQPMNPNPPWKPAGMEIQSLTLYTAG
jgi:hypothetical protein